MKEDRRDLKIQALLESLRKDKTKHESEIADLRVELTIVSRERDQLREQLDVMTAHPAGEGVDNEVVSQEDQEDTSD